MSRLQELIGEIHRRSLWQVLLIYIGGALVGYQAIQALTEGLGLPAWFPALAILLFIVGLPIVLATSFVQEGFLSARQDPTLLPESGMPVAAEVAGAKRLFTWRNAILGGAMAFGLWGVAVTGWLILSGRALTEPTAERTSVAVLPFTNMSAVPDNEYFSDGMTEEILNALAKVPELRVAARTSTFAYKGAYADLRQVGRELGVDAVLEGSVRREGEALRITAQLINVEDGFHLWSDTYNRSLKDVFAVQEEIATSIADALRVPLGLGAGEALVPHRTEDLEAYEMYLQARSLYKKRGAAVERAILLFDQVIERDSSFAPAWAGLAEAYAVLPFYAVIEKPGAVESLAGRYGADSATWENALTEAEKAALTAVELDPSIAEAHIALGNVRRDRWEWEAAEEHYRRALTLDPDYADGLEDFAELLSSVGRLDEALEAARRAKELDPLTPVFLNAYGATLRQKGLYAEAIEPLERAIAITPDLWFYYYELALAYVGLGRFGDAEEAARRSTTALGGEDPEVIIGMIRGIADPALRESAIATVSSYPHPELRVLLGDREGALRDLERYLFDPPYGPKWVIWDVFLEPLRDDPRFIELLRKMNLN